MNLRRVLRVSLPMMAAFAIGVVCDRVVRSHFVHAQTLVSEDGAHRAELWRSDGIDRNYFVELDGRRVYSSVDFSPRHDVPDRATLLWDRSGRILIFEVARHRLFGFDTTAGRPLTDSELLAARNADEITSGLLTQQTAFFVGFWDK